MSSPIFPPTTAASRIPDDTVSFAIYPDFSLQTPPNPSPSSQIHSLHLQIIQTITPYTSTYVWQHNPFTLTPSNPLPHLSGKLRYGDNLEDEWFVVFLLYRISEAFPDVTITVSDSDGEFLLIEAAFYLPKWINPQTSANRVFIRRGTLRIVPESAITNPSLIDSLRYIVNSEDEATVASEAVQRAIRGRIGEYPARAVRNMHRARVRVPVSVAQVLRHEPCLVSLAVEGFYDRDVDSMKFAARMERFLPRGRDEEFVETSVVMSRAMYAQLVQQTFQAPKCYPMPGMSDEGYKEAELGMKIACGLEMIYQMRKREGVEGKGSTWEAFRSSLERCGYFEGLLPGSKEYKRLVENAEEYYRKSSLHSRATETINAPVRRIDEILTHFHSADDFVGKEVPPSDDDSWLYNGEDELNAALLERQKELDVYNLKHKKKQSKEPQDSGPSTASYTDDHGLGNIAKSMQAFVRKMSSFEGAEVPRNSNLKDVDLDVDQFMKDIGSVTKPPHPEDDDDIEASSSDMDFDDFEYGSDDANASDDDEEGDTAFMHSYSDVLNKELKATTLGKSFVRASEPHLKKDEGTSKASEDMDEEFTPVDVDVNLVKSFLDSFSSQEGLPGPATNLLGLMGLHLPEDSNKRK